MANLTTSEVKKVYDSGGLAAVADIFDQQAEEVVRRSLLSISADPQKVAADNYARGFVAAYSEIATLLRTAK